MSEPRYPLAGRVVPGLERPAAGRLGVTFAERRPGSIVEIACWPESRPDFAAAVLPVLRIAELPPVGRFAAAPDVMVLGLAPGRFQALAREDGLAASLEAEVGSGTGAVVDLSHARAGIRIAGHDAERLLQTGLAFDLGLGPFAPGRIAQSAIHHMSVTVARLDPETFDLLVFRGFAVSLWEWATGAAEEFGWAGAALVR